MNVNETGNYKISIHCKLWILLTFFTHALTQSESILGAISEYSSSKQTHYGFVFEKKINNII